LRFVLKRWYLGNLSHFMFVILPKEEVNGTYKSKFEPVHKNPQL